MDGLLADFGAVSGALIFIKKELKISEVKVEILLDSLNLYSLNGSFAAGRICDRIGRRYTKVLALTTFFTGALLMCAANCYAILMLSNMVAGVGVGFAFIIAPLYTAEISPAASRGLLSTFPEVFMNVGLLLSYITTYSFSNLATRLSWRLMVGIGAIPSVLLVVGILAMPESPQWLVMQGRISDAEQPLGYLKLEENDVVEEARPNNSARVWKDMILHPTPPIRHVLIAAVCIHFFRQSSGVDATLLYGPTIFEKAGIAASDHLLLSTIAIGVVKLIFVLVAMFSLEKIGRRPLLLISLMGMILPLPGSRGGPHGYRSLG
ncbi:Major facilitator, sugar transporter-like [Parasponia andersonii]|uniref:Major facilitator, sugar transporter-like n=1 Tax=Parasponia andersonii TaxID=3476 RepID=A0A2P5DU82_PARAD|nr:Major facilitator, sugar transporter-like [Parasponia andersonii]